MRGWQCFAISTLAATIGLPTAAGAAGSTVRVVTMEASTGTQYVRLTPQLFASLGVCSQPHRYNNCFRQQLAKFGLKPEEVGQERSVQVRFLGDADFRWYYTCEERFARRQFFQFPMSPPARSSATVACPQASTPAAPAPPV